MHKHDVVVIGAGPIGSYTAYQLAKDGFDVLVIEKNKSFETPPACTGIIGLEAFEKFHLPEDSLISTIQNIKFVSPSGLLLYFRPPSILAHVVDRMKFDDSLRELARKNGATIRLDTVCEDVEVKDTCAEVKITGSRTPIKSRVVCVASGFNSHFVESLGLGMSSGYVRGVQTEVAIDGIEETEVYTGNAIAPGSFAWVVRINGEKARIGLTTKHNAPVLLSRFLKSPFLRHRIRERGTITSKIVPLGTVRRTFSDRLLLIGEAAGLMKTTTHGGIYYGLISSECAVRTLQKAFKERDFGKNTMSSYENLWKKHFDREIRSGLLIRKVFSQMRDGHIDGLFKIAMSDGVMDLVYKKARFDWHSDVIFSLFRHSLVGNMFRGLLPFAQHSRNN